MIVRVRRTVSTQVVETSVNIGDSRLIKTDITRPGDGGLKKIH